jgi:hypothetical protein
MIIKYYNRTAIFNCLPLLRESGFIKEQFTDDYIKLFEKANFHLMRNRSIADRTGANEFFIPFTKERPIPKSKGDFNKSFKQICEERSIQLLNTGKRLNVFWSGGIDSTVVLFSLMNKTNDLSQIRVILTTDSILESGSMFDLLIKNKIEYILHKNKITRQRLFDENKIDLTKELIITGCAADELNTTKRLHTIPAVDRKYDDMNYEDILSPLIDKNVMDFFNKSIKSYPKKIKYYKDFLKFYHMAYSTSCGLYSWYPYVDPKFLNIMDSFYAIEDFEKWCIWSDESNYTEKIKIPQKNLIYELSGDKLYCEKKGKGIGNPTKISDNNWFFLTEDNVTITYNDLLEKIKKNEQNYRIDKHYI